MQCNTPILSIRMLLVTACLVLAACARPAQQEVTLLAGYTMGGDWTVKITGDLPMPEEQLRAGIQGQFDVVDAALSADRPDSALNRFNSASHGQWQVLEPELFEVLRYALEIAQISRGAYDPTIAPLVDLWASRPDGHMSHHRPDERKLAQALALVGWRQVQLDVPRRRARIPPGVRVDLSSLDGGRGVDRVAWWLRGQGINDFLIDLSGKLMASGRNARRASWSVAVRDIETAGPLGLPRDGQIVRLQNQAIVTEDKRHPVRRDGRQYVRYIDPASGMPIDHGTASGTVLANECMVADAWATLLMLMPREDAIVLADRYALAAQLVAREGGVHAQLHSARWRREGL